MVYTFNQSNKEHLTVHAQLHFILMNKQNPEGHAFRDFFIINQSFKHLTKQKK
jgi:hypothetical protein